MGCPKCNKSNQASGNGKKIQMPPAKQNPKAIKVSGKTYIKKS